MLVFKVKKTGIIIKDWKWKAISNGHIVASGRGFNSKQGAIKSINAIVSHIVASDFSIVSE